MNVLSSVVTDIVVVAVVLGFMIFVHELGHFIAAKRFGVRVLVFSLGFGTRLAGFERGGTDYRLSILPLGGYVKMSGEDPSEPHKDDPGDFLAHPRWQRFFIAVAGPFMNIMTAFVILAALYHYHYQKPAYEEQPARIGDVQPSSPASAAGLEPGDVIVRAGNLEHPKWEDLQLKILTTIGQVIPMEVLRHGHLLNISLVPKAEGVNQIGYAGLYPCLPSVVGGVEQGMPAGRAGLEPGDKVLAVGSESVPCWQRLASALQSDAGKPVVLTVERDGKDFKVKLQPAHRSVSGQSRWLIGVTARTDMVVRQLPWTNAITASIDDNVRSTTATFVVLKKILSRRMSARSLSGPIGIAQISGEAYRAGISDLLTLVAFISLQLGIFNLLPIPILDGGMILLLLIEGMMRRDLSLRMKERVVQAGLFLLLLLVVFVTYNDIVKAIGRY
ncbi:MAG: RIP metalloprotease RseP [Terriglobia bacterium]